MSADILGVGAYAPRARLPADEVAEAWGQFQASGIESVAVPDPDEDALTMAYEAGRRALDAAGIDAWSLDAVALATTNPPAEEGGALPHLAAMLDAPESVETARHTGSTAAGVEAIRTAADGLGADECVLVVASDVPSGAPDETLGQGAGAGAAAFVLGEDGPATLVDTATASQPASGGRFRGRGETETEGLGITAYDRSVFRETVAAAVESVDVDTDRVDAVAVQSPDGKRPYRITDLLPVDGGRQQEHATVHDLGDTGAASAPLSLAVALADGASGVLTVGFGAGATAEVATVRTDGEIPSQLDLDGETDLEYVRALRQQGEFSSGPPSGGGAYVSIPAWHRSLDARYRLEAGRCPECGALNLPAAGACNACSTLVDYETVSLSGAGTVEAVSVISQGGAPPEFADLQTRSGEYATGIVAFDGPEGGSAQLPAMFVGSEPESVEIGDRVSATVRRIYEQEGVPRYGLKVEPAE